MKNLRLRDTAWSELRIAVPDELEELVADILLEFGSSGMEIRDDHTFMKSSETGQIQLVGFFEQPIVAAKLTQIRHALESHPMTRHLDWSDRLTAHHLQTEDWSTSWQKRFKPLYPTENVIIHPSWEPVQATPRQIAIQIDPKMAFGTGEHETTLMCVQALETWLRPGMRVLDLGTGTAILAILAEKMGATEILALDHDLDAIDAAHENIRINRAEKITLIQADLEDFSTRTTFDLVIGNLQGFIIKRCWSSINPTLTPANIGIFSGILITEVDDLKALFESSHLKILETRTRNEWALMTVRRHA